MLPGKWKQYASVSVPTSCLLVKKVRYLGRQSRWNMLDKRINSPSWVGSVGMDLTQISRLRRTTQTRTLEQEQEPLLGTYLGTVHSN